MLFLTSHQSINKCRKRLLTLICVLTAILPYKTFAFFSTLAFWQNGSGPPQAAFTPSEFTPNPSNSLSTRSIHIGGNGVIAYKAVAINSGSCTDAGVAGALTAASETDLSVAFSLVPSANTTNTVCAIGKSVSGIWQDATNPSASPALLIDIIAPTIAVGQMSINGGATSTINNYVNLDFQASDTLTNITGLCLRPILGGGVPSPSSCNWIDVGPITTGALPAQNLSLTNFDFVLGFAKGNYTVYAFVRDQAGNVSSLASSGNGQVGQDKVDITYNPGAPPLIQNTVAGNTDSLSYPLTLSQTIVPSGNDLYIKWKATAENGFDANPISLYYTTDDTNYTLIASGVTNSTTGACTTDANSTGCYVWTNGSPASTYYKIRVTATDLSGFTSIAASPALNTPSYQQLAGNTEAGLGGSAASGLFFNEVFGETYIDPQSFVITTDGKFVFRDTSLGLLIVDPADGITKLLIPKTGVITDGVLASATLKDPLRLALDNSNRILVYDHDRIRRIDLTADTITTLIGGGASQASGTLGTSFSIQVSNSAGRRQTYVTVSPDSKIYFEALHQRQTPNDGNSLYYYDPADGKVYLSRTASGTGYYGDASADLATTGVYRYIPGFDSATGAIDYLAASFCYSVVGSNQQRTANLDPATGVSTAPHPAYPGGPYCGWMNFFTDRNGQVWGMDASVGKVWKLTKSTNTWTLILGSGKIGYCPDGTLATSCDIELEDFYITSLGQIFFMNRGSLRTIDSGNKVVTVYGQAFSSGDGGSPLDARVKTLTGLNLTDANEVLFTDQEGAKLRSFTAGGTVIDSLAGNGTIGTITVGGTAVGQSITNLRLGYFVPNPANGDIFVVEYVGGNRLVRLNRSSGLWESVAGGGATYFVSADGLDGNQLYVPYSFTAFGFDGTRVLARNMNWTGVLQDTYFKLYDTSLNGKQSHLAGNANANSTMSADGTDVDLADVPNTSKLRLQYDGAASRWLFQQTDYGQSQKIRIIPTTGSPATISSLTTLPRAANNFYRVVNGASQDVIYYCATDGKIYKYNVQTSTETLLPIPPTVTCQSTPMARSASRNSVIFAIKSGNMSAISEIIDTP